MKLTGPLMSLGASGTIAGTVTFATWKGRAYARQTVRPSNPRSAAQTVQRAMMRFLTQAWADLTPTWQATWQNLADQIKASPFNAFCKDGLQRWTQFLTPRQQSNGIGGTYSTSLLSPTGSGGVRQAEITIPTQSLTDNWGFEIFRSDMNFPSLTKSLVRGVVRGTGAAAVSFTDTGLEAGTYYYWYSSFKTDGSNNTSTSSTVTVIVS